MPLLLNPARRAGGLGPLVRSAQPPLSTAETKTNHIGSRSLSFGLRLAATKLTAKVTPRRQPIDEDRQIFRQYMRCHNKLASSRKLDIMAAVRYCDRRAREGALSGSEKKEICDLFARFALLTPDLFYAPDYLANKPELQRVLSQELNILMHMQASKPELARDENHQLKISIAKAKLVVQFGCGVQSTTGGVNGAQIIKSFEGEPLGVFKPKQEVKWYHLTKQIKNLFGQARLLGKDNEEYAEEAAYKLDQYLGFRVAPAATMCQIDNNKGAFLAFLDGYKELKEVVPELNQREQFSEKELTTFQWATVYDFLTGNMDCHDENMFVRRDAEGRIIEVRIIDHGNSFIVDNPGEWGSKGNQYVWGQLNIAKQSFTAEVRERIANMTVRDLNRFITDLRPGFLQGRAKELLLQRFKILKEGACASPEELSKLHTDADFKAHLSTLEPMEFEEHNEDDWLVMTSR